MRRTRHTGAPPLCTLRRASPTHRCTPAALPCRSESWNGGYRAPGGSQVDGAFVRSSFLFKWSDSVGRAFVLRARSVGNALRNGDVGEVTAGGRGGALGRWWQQPRRHGVGRLGLLCAGWVHVQHAASVRNPLLG